MIIIISRFRNLNKIASCLFPLSMSRRKSLLHCFTAVALALHAAAPGLVAGERDELVDLLDLLKCSDGQICGPVAVNCSFDGSRGSSFLEITDQSNMTQYASRTPDVTVDDMPDPVPPPYKLSANNQAAPGNNGTCISRSPTMDASCGAPGSDECLIQPTIFDIKWLSVGELICMGPFPKGGTASLSDGVPPPGSVNAIATKQCKDYNYAPPWVAVVTDQWGSKWALQTSRQPEMVDDAAWEANLNAVVWPEGWTWENETLTTNRTHVSYLIGDDCWSIVLKDSQDNTWHMFEYPEELGTSILANIDCVPFQLSTAASALEEIASSSAETMMQTTISFGAALLLGVMM